MRLLVAEGRVFEVVWPADEKTCGVRGGSLCMADGEERFHRCDYTYGFYYDAATVEAMQRQKTRDRVRLSRGQKL